MLVQAEQCDKDVTQSSSVQLIQALQEVTKSSQRLHEVHVQCTPIMPCRNWGYKYTLHYILYSHYYIVLFYAD